jgi:predicted transposase YbfD/YdcC
VQQGVPEAGPACPCAATSSTVWRAVDAEHVNEVVMALLTRVRAAEGKEGEHTHVALDGTTVRGTQNHLAEDHKKMHPVNLYETATGIVLKEQIGGDTEREQTRRAAFFTPLDGKGRLVSAAAVHTHARVCASSIASAGDVLLFAKGHQSTLKNDVPLFFREPPVDCCEWRTARTVACGHGRLDMREMEVSTERNDFLAMHWPGMAHVCRLRRRVCTALVWTHEWVSGLTSLTPHQAGPDRLLALIREQWAMENRLHSRRDVTVREDACQVRTGSAPRTLAVLTSFLLAVFDWLAGRHVPSQMRIFSAQPLLALRLFTGSLASMK